MYISRTHCRRPTGAHCTQFISWSFLTSLFLYPEGNGRQNTGSNPKQIPLVCDVAGHILADPGESTQLPSVLRWTDAAGSWQGKTNVGTMVQGPVFPGPIHVRTVPHFSSFHLEASRIKPVVCPRVSDRILPRPPDPVRSRETPRPQHLESLQPLRTHSSRAPLLEESLPSSVWDDVFAAAGFTLGRLGCIEAQSPEAHT